MNRFKRTLCCFVSAAGRELVIVYSEKHILPHFRIIFWGFIIWGFHFLIFKNLLSAERFLFKSPNEVNYLAYSNHKIHYNYQKYLIKIKDPLVDFKALKVTKKHFKRISLVATQIEDEESKVPVNDVAILDYLKEMASYSREAYCLSAEKTYFPQEITFGIKEKVITKHLHRLMVFIKGKKGSPTDRRRRINHLSLYPDTNNNIRAGVDSEWFRNYLYREAEINVKIDSAMNNYDVLYQVVFTGHGEGGVYAILAGLSFQRRHPTMRPYTNLVTYGAPRPGDRAFANHISAMFPEHLRVVNNNDWFPHMPTKAEKYQHPKTEYWISNANCNCGEVNDMADYILYKCLPEARGEDGFFIDENQNCHAGTTLIDSPLSQASHIGPYFGIQMNCSTMKDSMFKE